MHQETLTEIANRYGTDKGTIGPSERHQGHNYTDTYEGYLSNQREDPLRLLEIGLGARGTRVAQGRNAEGGASVKMWRDYFPRAAIFGIDILDGSYLDDDRIKTTIVNQGNKEQLEQFINSIGPVDIIIDDGSHRADHQQLSLGVLFPFLTSGGLYFIEDLRPNGLDEAAELAKPRPDFAPIHSTRRLLLEFRASATFLEPNALENAVYLRDHIAQIAFHCPKLTIVKQRRRAGGPAKLKADWAVGMEALCMIRKKSAPL